MSSSLGLLLVVGGLLARLPEAPTHWELRGQVRPVGRNRELGPAEKTFRVQVFVVRSSPEAAQAYWVLDENGRGRWHWSRRFGRMELLPQGRVEGQRPTLLYRYRGHDYALMLVLPWPELPGPVEAGVQWSDQRLRYQVREPLEPGKQKTWELVASNNYGWQHIWSLDRKTLGVLQVRQRVFLGQGHEHHILTQVIHQGKIPPESYAQLVQGFELLTSLQSKLGPVARASQHLDSTQLELLREQLPQLERRITAGPLVSLVREARRDLETQSQRTSAVEQLVAQLVGKPMPEFQLTGLGGARLNRQGLQGHVTVLHFWEYRHSPLREPYGQVGYLDFLYHRYRGKGLQLYGIAVNRELAVPARKAQAQRSVRKLAQFMNLSYPVLYDSGELLAQLGDPRRLGAQLPLYVVVGPDGKVIHAHVGFYPVDRFEGLKQLDQIVRRALQQKR